MKGEKIMKRGTISYIICLLLLLAATPSVIAHTGHEMEGEGKVAKGVEGWLRVSPEMNRIDFYLYDAKTDKAITDAKVKAIFTLPDGKKIRL